MLHVRRRRFLRQALQLRALPLPLTALVSSPPLAYIYLQSDRSRLYIDGFLLFNWSYIVIVATTTASLRSLPRFATGAAATTGSWETLLDMAALLQRSLLLPLIMKMMSSQTDRTIRPAAGSIITITIMVKWPKALPELEAECRRLRRPHEGTSFSKMSCVSLNWRKVLEKLVIIILLFGECVIKLYRYIYMYKLATTERTKKKKRLCLFSSFFVLLT